jgi:hypothetical protein
MADTPLLAAIAAAASITGALVTALVSYRSSRRAGSEQRELAGC